MSNHCNKHFNIRLNSRPAPRPDRQQGGTILGLIIGLIIGLGIAVVVAVTIKNTPLPFVDKMGRSDRPHADRVGDPNKPLYGNREPAKEAAKQFSRKSEDQQTNPATATNSQPPENPSATAQAPKDASKAAEAKKPESRADAKTDPKPDAKTAAEDKAAAEKAPADKTDEKFTYYLQAGAFLEKTDAENTRAKLALLGFSANIAEKQSDNGTLYRVRIGPFSQQETMNRMRTKLSDNGIDAAVVRMPK